MQRRGGSGGCLPGPCPSNQAACTHTPLRGSEGDIHPNGTLPAVTFSACLGVPGSPSPCCTEVIDTPPPLLPSIPLAPEGKGDQCNIYRQILSNISQDMYIGQYFITMHSKISSPQPAPSHQQLGRLSHHPAWYCNWQAMGGRGLCFLPAFMPHTS